MKLKRRVFVVGGHITPFIGKNHPDFVWKRHPDFGKRENPTLEEHLTAAILGALESTGVDASAIQRGAVGNFVGSLFSNQAHLGSMAVRAHEGLHGTPFVRTEAACASGGLAVTSMIDAIQAGLDVTLACGAEVQTTVSARDGAGFLARASHWATERDIDDFTFPAMFARRNKAYQEAFGVTEEELAHIVVKAYANGNKNPNAHMKAVQMTLENASAPNDRNPQFLRNEDLREYLKVSDCSQVSDGAAAMILASKKGLKRLGLKPKDCVEITAYGHATSPLGAVTDYTTMSNTAKAAAEMYADAKLKPKHVQVAEVHDCFHVTEALISEALGFAKPGQGAKLAVDGATAIDGSIPINTGGGLIAFGHPVGATGVKQALEVVRQMKGECGDYQIAKPPKVGITANMGGDDRTSVCMAFQA